MIDNKLDKAFFKIGLIITIVFVFSLYCLYRSSSVTLDEILNYPQYSDTIPSQFIAYESACSVVVRRSYFNHGLTSVKTDKESLLFYSGHYTINNQITTKPFGSFLEKGDVIVKNPNSSVYMVYRNGKEYIFSVRDINNYKHKSDKKMGKYKNKIYPSPSLDQSPNSSKVCYE